MVSFRKLVVAGGLLATAVSTVQAKSNKSQTAKSVLKYKCVSEGVIFDDGEFDPDGPVPEIAKGTPFHFTLSLKNSGDEVVADFGKLNFDPKWLDAFMLYQDKFKAALTAPNDESVSTVAEYKHKFKSIEFGEKNVTEPEEQIPKTVCDLEQEPEEEDKGKETSPKPKPETKWGCGKWTLCLLLSVGLPVLLLVVLAFGLFFFRGSDSQASADSESDSDLDSEEGETKQKKTEVAQP